MLILYRGILLASVLNDTSPPSRPSNSSLLSLSHFGPVSLYLFYYSNFSCKFPVTLLSTSLKIIRYQDVDLYIIFRGLSYNLWIMEYKAFLPIIPSHFIMF